MKKIFCIIQYLLMYFLFSSFSDYMYASNSGLFNKSKKIEKSYLDSSLKQLSGPLSFDKNTEEALSSSKEAGVIQSKYEIANHIYRIEVKGLYKVEPEAILLRLNSKLDNIYDINNTSKDIVAINEMGLFENIQVYAKTLPSNAIVLKYVFKEIPTIFQIKIKGNDILSQEEIQKAISGLENYQAAKDSIIKENQEKIKNLYLSKGYFLAQVDYEIQKTSNQEIAARDKNENKDNKNLTIDTTKVYAPDFVDIVFSIKENDKIKVNKVDIVGLKKLDEQIIKERLKTQEGHLLSIVSDWGIFRKEFIDIDSFIIENILHENGMIKAVIRDPIIEISSDKSTVNVQYRIEENTQYYLENLNISGDLIADEDSLFSKKYLMKFIEQKEGEVFNKTKISQAAFSITREFKDKGYAYANISINPTFDEEKNTINIEIKAESGEKAKIHKIYIEGNDKTNQEVIMRELKIAQEDYYSLSNLEISENNIKRLGFFQSVELIEEPSDKADNINIRIKVTEKSTGGVQLGASYTTSGEGIIFKGQISNENLFGRGQSISFSIDWSNYRRMFDLSFIEPYAFYLFKNHPFSIATSIYNREMIYEDFLRKSSGLSIGSGFAIGSFLNKYSNEWLRNTPNHLRPYILDFDALYFKLTYMAERVLLHDNSSKVRQWNLFQNTPRYTTSLKANLTLDQRNNRINPSRGYYLDFSTELALGNLGSSLLSNIENNISNQANHNLMSSGLLYLKPKASGNNFIRYLTNARFYYDFDNWFIWKGFILKKNFELGFLNDFGNPLYFENFFLGGLTSLRGYASRSISPSKRVSGLNPFDKKTDLKIGGVKDIHGSLELEFPLINFIKLNAVLFLDYGNVYSHEDNLFFAGNISKSASMIKVNDPLKIYDTLGLYSSVGFGFRWDSPMGLLRFEWGFPLVKRKKGTPSLPLGDAPFSFEFGGGTSF